MINFCSFESKKMQNVKHKKVEFFERTEKLLMKNYIFLGGGGLFQIYICWPKFALFRGYQSNKITKSSPWVSIIIFQVLGLLHFLICFLLELVIFSDRSAFRKQIFFSSKFSKARTFLEPNHLYQAFFLFDCNATHQCKKSRPPKRG